MRERGSTGAASGSTSTTTFALLLMALTCLLSLMAKEAECLELPPRRNNLGGGGGGGGRKVRGYTQLNTHERERERERASQEEGPKLGGRTILHTEGTGQERRNGQSRVNYAGRGEMEKGPRCDAPFVCPFRSLRSSHAPKMQMSLPLVMILVLHLRDGGVSQRISNSEH